MPDNTFVRSRPQAADPGDPVAAAQQAALPCRIHISDRGRCRRGFSRRLSGTVRAGLPAANRRPLQPGGEAQRRGEHRLSVPPRGCARPGDAGKKHQCADLCRAPQSRSRITAGDRGIFQRVVPNPRGARAGQKGHPAGAAVRHFRLHAAVCASRRSVSPDRDTNANGLFAGRGRRSAVRAPAARRVQPGAAAEARHLQHRVLYSPV